MQMVSLRKHPFPLALRRWGRSRVGNVPSGEERGETDVVAGYKWVGRECKYHTLHFKNSKK